MKKYRFLPFLLAFFFITVPLSGILVHAQTSISGDEVCGGSAAQKCTLADMGEIVKGILTLVISLGLPLLLVFVTYRFVMAWFSLQQGNANAYKEALQKAGNAILGFFFVVALFGGLLFVALQYFGVKEESLKLLKLFSEAFIPHAYAEEGKFLPNPVGVNNLYDFLISALRLVMRFFIYPALIVIWVWTGFAFIAAQGAPDALTKAKKWLMWAVITTFVIFMLQTFLVALRGTVQAILPGSQTSQTNTNTNPIVQPGAPNNPGGLPTTPGATTGANYCVGKAVGTLCDVPVTGGVRAGTCSNNAEGAFGCYVAAQGDACITAVGVYGQINGSGACAPGQRPLVGKGGSCRISQECGGSLSCVDNICN